MLPFCDRRVTVARKDVAPVWTRSFPIANPREHEVLWPSGGKTAISISAPREKMLSIAGGAGILGSRNMSL